MVQINVAILFLILIMPYSSEPGLLPEILFVIILLPSDDCQALPLAVFLLPLLILFITFSKCS